MDYRPALLEHWLRDHYFSTRIDIASSGVENFALGDLRDRLGISESELDRVVFGDSPTVGALDLRETIAKRWCKGQPERIMATSGSSEAIYLVMHALLRREDEVIVLDPMYFALHQIAEAIGCRIVRWRLLFDEDFVPDLDSFRRLISVHTRMVILNFPHNPTGSTVSPEEQQEIIRIVSRSGAYLLWDSAFADLTYNAPPLPDTSNLYERGISVGTLSKAYGLAGLRVGWCIAPPEVLARCINLRDYTTLYLSPLSELLATKAIQGADLLVAIRLQQARSNKEILKRWVDNHPHFVQYVDPVAGVCAFIRLCNNVEAFDFCLELARMCSVLLVPGSCFGNYKEFVRLGFGGRTSDLQKGLLHLSNVLAKRFPVHSGSGQGTPS